jgi:arylsulfatase
MLALPRVSRIAILVVAVAVFGWSATAAPAPRPNILVIMSDDMGWSDLGCYGGELRTPALDSLAAGGIRFTQFYNTARCCPTRASLLTGLYPHQAGIGHMMDDKGRAAYRGELSRNCVTIAEALKAAGYAAYAVGKWHVTKATDPKSNTQKHNWPLQRGFDRFYGTIHGAGSFWDPSSLVRDNHIITAFNDTDYQPRGEYYYTDAISDHATRFIAEHSQRDPRKPFFLYVAYTAAHWPMHAKEADVAKWKGRFDAGYEAARQARLAKQRDLGLLDGRWQPTPTVGDWAAVTNRAFEARCMEVYAAMVECMDEGIGRIVAELKKHRQFENTLVLFLQDNGGCAELMGRGPNFTPRADKPTLEPLSKDFLQHGSTPKQTRDGYPVRQGHGVMPGPADTYIGYGREWANVSNTPFREYKHWVHEGGISTPLIAHWPDGIGPARRNSLAHAPSHLIDVMATCVDLAGAAYPAARDGQPIKPLEGVSLTPVFRGEPLARPQPLFWEHEGNRAVRDGRWKLVSKFRGEWELYDMEADRTEMVNLAAAQPGKVAQLSAAYDVWSGRAGVVAWAELNPQPGGKKGAQKEK